MTQTGTSALTGGTIIYAANAADVLNPTLADNGGPTQTHALVAGSPAIDAGDPAFDPNALSPPLTLDQRGYKRLAHRRVDIGAYEFSQPPVIAVNTGLTVWMGASAGITSGELQVTDPDLDPVTFTLNVAPAKGTLKLNGVGLSVGQTFTSAALESGDPLSCPPLELRGPNGELVRKLKNTREPQPIVAAAGIYSIVGHDPAGGERLLRLHVTDE